MIDRNQIPSSWEVVKLGEVCENIKSGYPCGNHNSAGIGYLHFRPFNININGTVDLSLSKFVPLKSNEYFLKEGDVIFNNTNSPELLGKTCFIRKANSWVYSNHMTRIRVKEYVNPEYCASYLHYLFYKGYYRLHCSNHVNQASISSSFLNKFVEIPLPPLPEQHRIVSKIEELFSELDKGIESLKTARQQLKIYRQAVLKWAFEGRLTNENVKDGELPEGWRKVKIVDVAAINPKLPYENIMDTLEVSFLPMKLEEEEKNQIHLTEFKKYSETKKGFTPMTNGDVIFAKITPCMENGKIAVVHSLKNNIAFGSTEFHVLRCKDNLSNYLLFYFLVQEKFRKEAEHNMTGAVGQRRVPKKFIEDSIIPVPPLSEQHQIVQEIETRLSVCDKLEETITTALQQSVALRQSILKKAFEGKLVAQNPEDEPASKLLERIKAEREKNDVLKKKIPKG